MNRWVLLFALLAGCAAGFEGGDEPVEEDLPLGQISDEDSKADGHWGHALDCKSIPDLPPLADPHISISIDGLSLRLVDRAGDYDRVFPIGVGEVENNPNASLFGESLSYFPVWSTQSKNFEIKTTDNWNFNPCRVWWTSDTGEQLPVFAGLPFIRFHGPYGIHGPITGYRAANGGTLERGYVSHGCIRMEAADVTEVYALISGVSEVPVRVQRAPLRVDDGRRLEPRPWIGSECQADDDCDFDGGFCKANPVGGRGFCTTSCDRLCPDRKGDAGTFCVADPEDGDSGICVPRVGSANGACRHYDHMIPEQQDRFGEPGLQANVCMPGSRGWVGDRCLADGDCTDGTHCEGAVAGAAGICTMSCQQYCPDQPGRPTTLCVDESDLGGATCLRQCDPEEAGADCPAGSTCLPRARNGEATADRWACVPD